MKKTLLALLSLLILVGCSQTNNSPSYDQTIISNEQENTDEDVLSVYGVLNENILLKNLEYKVSTCWQFMRSDVNDKMVGKYDKWHTYFYTDSNLIMVFGYVEDEETKIIKYNDIDNAIDSLVNNEIKGKGYSFVETVLIDDRYGFVVDVSDDNVTKRILFINGNGGKYEISFSNQTDSLSTLSLQFAYDYINSLHFNDSKVNTNTTS